MKLNSLKEDFQQNLSNIEQKFQESPQKSYNAQVEDILNQYSSTGPKKKMIGSQSKASAFSDRKNSFLKEPSSQSKDIVGSFAQSEDSVVSLRKINKNELCI